MSADKQDHRATRAEDLDLTTSEAALVKGGMLPIEGGGDSLVFVAPTVTKKRKKKAKRRYYPGGGRPAP